MKDIKLLFEKLDYELKQGELVEKSLQLDK